MDKIEQYLGENNAILTIMDLMIYRTKAVSMPQNIQNAINFLQGHFDFIYQYISTEFVSARSLFADDSI